jgi:single-strand DNA-binding protein
MYLNNVTLAGFIGGDAETRTTKSNTTFTVFSLATKNSWKDRESGEWTSRTEWHRAAVFGRLTDLAGTLKKGDHVQIQGQLRTREYEKNAEGRKKSATTEIRVTSILKLDRNWKQNGGQPEVQEVA